METELLRPASLFIELPRADILGNAALVPVPVRSFGHPLARLPSAFVRAVSPAAPLGTRLEPILGRAVGHCFHVIS
jgi:hypothetical protein